MSEKILEKIYQELVLIRVELQALRSGIDPETQRKISDGVFRGVLKQLNEISKRTDNGTIGGEKHAKSEYKQNRQTR